MGRPSKRAEKIRNESEFDSARLQRELAIPKTGTSLTPSWSLADIFRAREAQMSGKFQLAARAAESMRTDDALFVAYGNRLAPQRCIQVEIVSATEKGKALSVAKEAEALFGVDGVGIESGALDDINGCLVNHGVAFGVNVMLPREDGSRVDILHRYWPIEFVRWDPILKMFVTRVDPDTAAPGDLLPKSAAAGGMGSLGTYEIPIIHGDGRWTIYTNHAVDPFKQEAAILPALAVWARHAFALRDWAKGSVAHGNAKIVGEMPEGVALQTANGLTPEAAAMIALLRDLASGDTPVGLRPAKSKTDFITNTSSAWQVWSELIGNGEKAAARIYLGTDGTLGTQGGAPGIDISELFGVAVTKVKGDLGCIQRSFGEGVIQPWAALNFGDSSLAPTRRYMIPDADEDAWHAAIAARRKAFNDDIAQMRSNGFVIDQDVIDVLALEHDVTAPTLPVIEADAPKAPTIALAPTDLASVVTVNEARASAGVSPLLLADGSPDPDGNLMIEQYRAKQAALAAAPPSADGVTNGAGEPSSLPASAVTIRPLV
jgi:hypothetical protein